MTEEDRQLVRRISQGLQAAQVRLAEDQNGVSEWSSHPVPEDRTNARLELHRDQIRRLTGRRTIRDVLVDQFANEFRRDGSLSVTQENGAIRLETKTEIERGNFTTLEQLEAFVARPEQVAEEE